MKNFFVFSPPIFLAPILIALTSIPNPALCAKNDDSTQNHRSRLEFLREQTHLYKDGLQPDENYRNPFNGRAEILHYDSLMSKPDNSEELNGMLANSKAYSFLKIGDERKAISILKGLVSTADDNNALIDEERSMLALAYLRLGERNNCIMGHGEGSCIFPIQGKGIYNDPSATQKGIKLYIELLTKHPDDLESRWLLNIAYMTIGLYPSKVPPEFLIPGLEKDTSSVTLKPFTDMAGSLNLIDSKNMAGGAISDDFDNDGYLDIVTSNWGLKNGMHYYKNNGNGSFSDFSKQSGLDAIKGGLNIIQADYNNDGFKDILVLRGAWLGEYGNQPTTLLRNNGNGTFTDVTVESGILSLHPTQTATWADFNQDGWLDLFIGAETTPTGAPHPSELFINQHNGTFINVAGQAGASYIAFMKGVTSADYNNDGWPDIFISTQSGQKILLRNMGLKSFIPEFEESTKQAGLDKDDEPTFPTWFWDYNNDGWPDIFVSGYPSTSFARIAAQEALNLPLEHSANMQLFRNNKDGTFTNVSKETGLDRPVFAMGANFGDVDNDGWLDMYLGTGDPSYKSLVPNKMFKNIDGKTFADVTSSARVGNLQKGHGVSFTDLDNDGDQDLFVDVGGAYEGDAFYNSCYINPGQNTNNWISIELEGTKANRSAIGARLEVTFRENGIQRTVFRDVNSGGSFGSSPLRKQIGIGKAERIDQILIRWPNQGKNVEIFRDIDPNQFVRIKQGGNGIEKINLKKLTFVEQNMAMPMDMNNMLMKPGS